jgi:UTP:GlnB (protein PII) uridylyltransferase
VSLLELADSLRARCLSAGVSEAVIDRISSEAPRVWWSASVDDLLADVLLVAPGLVVGQVRIRILPPMEGNRWELSVVAPDRPGLLAVTAMVCAAHDFSIRSARVTSWPGIALQRLMVEPLGLPLSAEPDFNQLGQALRAALTTETADVEVSATQPLADSEDFSIDSIEDLGQGMSRVAVSGRDRLGLLSSIALALGAAGADICAAELSDVDGVVHDVFVVTGLDRVRLASTV